MDGDENEDSNLVKSAAQGDSAAFGKIFNRHYSMIYAFAYRLCLDHSSAHDIAQETFIKAVRSIGSVSKMSSLKSWLYRIALNAARDWLRSEGRRGRLGAAMIHRATPSAVSEDAEHPLLIEALTALPENLRQAITLVFYEEMTHAEAARVLGCAETTVSRRIFRAKRKLKEHLSRQL